MLPKNTWPPDESTFFSKSTAADDSGHGLCRVASVHIACAFSIVEILAVLYRSHLAVRRGRSTMGGPRLSGAEQGARRDGPVRLPAGNRLADRRRTCKRISATARGSRVWPMHMCRASKSRAARWGMACRSASAWRWRPSGAARNQRCFRNRRRRRMQRREHLGSAAVRRALRLNNLIVIVDANGLQAMGRTDEVMRLGSWPTNCGLRPGNPRGRRARRSRTGSCASVNCWKAIRRSRRRWSPTRSKATACRSWRATIAGTTRG